MRYDTGRVVGRAPGGRLSVRVDSNDSRKLRYKTSFGQRGFAMTSKVSLSPRSTQTPPTGALRYPGMTRRARHGDRTTSPTERTGCRRDVLEGPVLPVPSAPDEYVPVPPVRPLTTTAHPGSPRLGGVSPSPSTRGARTRRPETRRAGDRTLRSNPFLTTTNSLYGRRKNGLLIRK